MLMHIETGLACPGVISISGSMEPAVRNSESAETALMLEILDDT